MAERGPLGGTVLAVRSYVLIASRNLWSARLGFVIPGLLPGQEFGELRLQDAEFVAPRVAQDPEVKAAFGLVIPAGGAVGFQPADFGFHVVGFQVEVHTFRRLAARPVGAASTIVAPLALASSTTERTVNDLPQPGPPVRTATLAVRASRTASACSGASSEPVRPRSQPRALSQSTAANPASRSARAACRRSRARARDRSA